MSDNSPFFFMREFSNEELTQLLVNKVKELKNSKKGADELNKKLEDSMINLELVQAQLREKNTDFESIVKEKAEHIVKTEKLAAIGELSARIAHDLRNPLSVLKNTAEIIRIDLEPGANERTIKHISRLDRAINRISHQVEDVLDFLRPVELKISKHSLLLVLQDSVEKIEFPENISIKVPKNDYSILIDNEKIDTVFVNLITNAIQTIGKDPGKIKINFKEENDLIIIEVSDNGPGIPSEFLEKVFDPLFTTRQIGTGLGLPSCKNIIERHGGNITASNKRECGAKFTIMLPAKSEFESIEEGFAAYQTIIRA